MRLSNINVFGMAPLLDVVRELGAPGVARLQDEEVLPGKFVQITDAPFCLTGIVWHNIVDDDGWIFYPSCRSDVQITHEPTTLRFSNLLCAVDKARIRHYRLGLHMGAVEDKILAVFQGDGIEQERPLHATNPKKGNDANM